MLTFENGRYFHKNDSWQHKGLIKCIGIMTTLVIAVIGHLDKASKQTPWMSA